MAEWFVLREGDKEPAGPYGREEIRELLAKGKLGLEARANAVGTDAWVRLREVMGREGPPNDDSSARGSASQDVPPGNEPRTSVRSGLRTAYVLIGVGAVLAIELGVASYLLLTALERQHVERRDAQEQARQEDLKRAEEEKAAARTEQRGTVVALDAIAHDCLADNSVATCYLTNGSDKPLVACMQGIVMQKESAGIRLYSMPMCTGPIPPMTTKQVSAPWVQGRVVDLCHDVRGFLEWDKCDFKVINHELKAPK